MSEVIAGISIPDSKMAKEATELVRTMAPDLIFQHSRRVFLFGTLQGRRLDLQPDPELLYVSAMFHDLGLVDGYRRTDQRFELDGADAAARFLRSYGLPDSDVQKAWNSIALHTTPEIPYRMEPEVALVTAGVEADVLGFGLEHLTHDDLTSVIAAHPRSGFKKAILEAFRDGFKDRPNSTFGTVNADVLEYFFKGYSRMNFVEVIKGSSWPE
ncbi:HD domain-containing protein [Arthrobacter crusticola]|uniref:HD domain-containing protein n=1 Tax=Arthrobacter crusticola TaxID=2547960 RepID=A0A4R5TMP2_9MICC|nr:HD domain-containing protein [Arthrobacter crusticola]TDK23935.1 HD domain-containing protein [Arthrobacter crusticola]